MNKQAAQYSDIIINSFGQMVRQSTLDAIEYKGKLIKSIMMARHKCGYPIDLNALDKIADMDIDELERLGMEYDELIERRRL